MISICPVERLYEVLPIGKRFFEYAKEKGKYNPQFILNFWGEIYQQRNGFMLIEEKANEIKGFCGVVFYQEPWTGELVASEVCLYSEGVGGGFLIANAEKIVRKCGAKIFYLQHLENGKSERLAKFYTNIGYQLGYSRFFKEL